MKTGKVRWYDDTKGFGFITPDDGSEDLYVQFATISKSGFKFLEEKQKVTFDVLPDDEGEQVSDIQIVS